MRKFIFLSILLASIISTSCSKDDSIDYSNPHNIAGTTWKCVLYPAISQDIEYSLLVFTTTTEVEGWTKEIEAAKQKVWTGSFTISNDTISITNEQSFFHAIISEETISIRIMDGTVLKFIKQ